MKKALLLLLLLAGCASGGHMMTMNTYHDVSIGSTQEEVIATMGKPISTKTLPDGSIQYEYVERIKVGGRNLEERRYHIILKDGKVVSKEMKYGEPPAYKFDSYEMQTTQADPNN
jgi:outer membrane protein assembly factor BamE (lipoprotein component of BamABCDE complex)